MTFLPRRLRCFFLLAIGTAAVWLQCSLAAEANDIRAVTHPRVAGTKDWQYVFVKYSAPSGSSYTNDDDPGIVSVSSPTAEETVFNKVGLLNDYGWSMPILLKGIRDKIRSDDKFSMSFVFQNSFATKTIDAEVQVYPDEWYALERPSFTGGDGSGYDERVIIKGQQGDLAAGSEMFAIFNWMEKHNLQITDLFADKTVVLGNPHIARPSDLLPFGKAQDRPVTPVIAKGSDGAQYYFETNRLYALYKKQRFCSAPELPETVNNCIFRDTKQLHSCYETAPSAVLNCFVVCYDSHRDSVDCTHQQ